MMNQRVCVYVCGNNHQIMRFYQIKNQMKKKKRKIVGYIVVFRNISLFWFCPCKMVMMMNLNESN